MRIGNKKISLRILSFLLIFCIISSIPVMYVDAAKEFENIFIYATFDRINNTIVVESMKGKNNKSKNLPEAVAGIPLDLFVSSDLKIQGYKDGVKYDLPEFEVVNGIKYAFGIPEIYWNYNHSRRAEIQRQGNFSVDQEILYMDKRSFGKNSAEKKFVNGILKNQNNGDVMPCSMPFEKGNGFGASESERKRANIITTYLSDSFKSFFRYFGIDSYSDFKDTVDLTTQMITIMGTSSITYKGEYYSVKIGNPRGEKYDKEKDREARKKNIAYMPDRSADNNPDKASSIDDAIYMYIWKGNKPAEQLKYGEALKIIYAIPKGYVSVNGTTYLESRGNDYSNDSVYYTLPQLAFVAAFLLTSKGTDHEFQDNILPEKGIMEDFFVDPITQGLNNANAFLLTNANKIFRGEFTTSASWVGNFGFYLSILIGIIILIIMIIKFLSNYQIGIMGGGHARAIAQRGFQEIIVFIMLSAALPVIVYQASKLNLFLNDFIDSIISGNTMISAKNIGEAFINLVACIIIFAVSIGSIFGDLIIKTYIPVFGVLFIGIDILGKKKYFDIYKNIIVFASIGPVCKLLVYFTKAHFAESNFSPGIGILLSAISLILGLRWVNTRIPILAWFKEAFSSAATLGLSAIGASAVMKGGARVLGSVGGKESSVKAGRSGGAASGQSHHSSGGSAETVGEGSSAYAGAAENMNLSLRMRGNSEKLSQLSTGQNKKLTGWEKFKNDSIEKLHDLKESAASIPTQIKKNIQDDFQARTGGSNNWVDAVKAYGGMAASGIGSVVRTTARMGSTALNFAAGAMQMAGGMLRLNPTEAMQGFDRVIDTGHAVKDNTKASVNNFRNFISTARTNRFMEKAEGIVGIGGSTQEGMYDLHKNMDFLRKNYGVNNLATNNNGLTINYDFKNVKPDEQQNLIRMAKMWETDTGREELKQYGVNSMTFTTIDYNGKLQKVPSSVTYSLSKNKGVLENMGVKSFRTNENNPNILIEGKSYRTNPQTGQAETPFNTRYVLDLDKAKQQQFRNTPASTSASSDALLQSGNQLKQLSS